MSQLESQLPIRISNAKLVSAGGEEVANGLIGYVSCILNGTFHLDGLALRRTIDGRRALSFPSRRDGAGRQHFYIRPMDNIARMEIEAQVFKALGIDQGTSK
jgi:hypothetical protein